MSERMSFTETPASPSESDSDIGLRFQIQIGLVREQITVPAARITLPALREQCCSFVDRKVCIIHDGTNMTIIATTNKFKGPQKLWSSNASLLTDPIQ